MKTLLLIRHAKSSWEVQGGSDFDRPLNARGKQDAPEMARRLLKRKIGIDLFVSSPAKRAKKTAELFVKEFNGKEKEIQVLPDLYEAGVQTFYDRISGLHREIRSVAVFSHNPGITEFANTLTLTQVDNIPTCGVFAVSVPIEDWARFPEAEKRFAFFDFPKSV
jgi:phosphohistidine phosphatase